MGKTVYDLSREQLIELKQGYFSELVNEGCFAEIMGTDHDEPSYADLLEADEKIPDEFLYEKYGETRFTDDDFFCTAAA